VEGAVVAGTVDVVVAATVVEGAADEVVAAVSGASSDDEQPPTTKVSATRATAGWRFTGGNLRPPRPYGLPSPSRSSPAPGRSVPL